MQRRLVVFAAAGQEYALPVERVREVAPWREPRSLGAAEPWLLGVVSLRGTLLQVVDLALRLGLEPGPRSLLVVFDAPDGPAGLAIEAVDAVVAVAEERIGPPPQASGEAVAGIAALDERIVVVLEPDALLGPRPKPAPRRRAPRRRSD